jgi:tetratricopeptide (TPR) repeat protein
MRREPVICVLLAAATLVVFGQTLRHSFINFDDDIYVYENPLVMGGVTLGGAVRAFTQVHASNWHPVTWLSHMLDCELYGLSPGGHHLTSVLLHAAAVILLFVVLHRMTGALWQSAVVAAVFGVHPLHVESVAWVAERKDVLSGLLFVLTLVAYMRYAREAPTTSRYLTVVVLFAVGLMCKPMLVTLPVVLLLLDHWPLRRSTRRGVIVEKLPLFALAAVACVVTLVAQREAIRTIDEVPLAPRIENAAVSYVTYLAQTVYPTCLAPFYPFASGALSPWRAGGAAALLLGGSVGSFVVRHRHPYVIVGWLWYLVMLAPVIGVVQFGGAARADRYMYLPQIGICLLVVWGTTTLAGSWRHGNAALATIGAAVIASLVACAHRQTAYWRNSETLWTHTLECTTNNGVAHNNLGAAVLDAGRLDEAITHFKRALEINPRNTFAWNNLGSALIQAGDATAAIVPFTKALEVDPRYASAHNGLGNALLQTGRTDEATAHYRRALELQPDDVEAHNGLGNALLQTGRIDAAIGEYERALALNPNHTEAHNGLGGALLRNGRVDEAIEQYRLALAAEPGHALSHNGLATAFVQAGRMDQAIAHYEEALRLKPDLAGACNNLAWVLATYPDDRVRDGAKAVALAERADHLAGGRNPVYLATLAAAYAEAARFDDAVRTARRAIDLATARGQTALADQTRDRLELFENGRPFHDEPRPGLSGRAPRQGS